jgi:hypothetical protein
MLTFYQWAWFGDANYLLGQVYCSALKKTKNMTTFVIVCEANDYIIPYNWTWTSCWYTLLVTMNWWKRWIDFVKIKFDLNDLILNEFTSSNLNWMQLSWIWFEIKIPKLNLNTFDKIHIELNWIAFGWIESNSIQFNAIQIDWIQTNFYCTVDLPLQVHHPLHCISLS